MNKLSVLIVDDSEVDRYILIRMLRKLEFEITIFEEVDGQRAIKFMSDCEENQIKYPGKFPPLITFLDINMPVKNGHEYLAEYSEIRSKHNMSDSVVMMLTSSAREDDHALVSQYEFVTGFLIKGEFSDNDLHQSILACMT